MQSSLCPPLLPFRLFPFSVLFSPPFCLDLFPSCHPLSVLPLSIFPPFCLAPLSVLLLCFVLLPGFPDVWTVRTQRVKLYLLWLVDGEVELPARISQDRNELKKISQPFWRGCQVFVTECLKIGVLFERS